MDRIDFLYVCYDHTAPSLQPPPPPPPPVHENISRLTTYRPIVMIKGIVEYGSEYEIIFKPRGNWMCSKWSNNAWYLQTIEQLYFAIQLNCGDPRILLESNSLVRFCSHFQTEFSQTNFIFIWLRLSCISWYGCFPVKLPNHFIAEAPSNPLLNLPFNFFIILRM